MRIVFTSLSGKSALPVFLKLMLLLAACLFTALPLFAETINLNSIGKTFYLGRHIDILEDESGEMTLNEAREAFREGRSVRSNRDILYYRFTESAYWIHFKLESPPGQNESSFIIELEYPLMDTIAFYEIDEMDRINSSTTGYTLPFRTRQIHNRHFLFPVTVLPGKTKEYFFRLVNSDRMEIPLRIWENERFHQSDHNEQLIMGGYISILMLILITNLIMGLLIKERRISFFLHILFILSFALFQLTQNGYISEFFPFFVTAGLSHDIPFTIGFLLISTLLFTNDFLEIKRSARTFYSVNLVLIALVLFSFLAHFFITYPASISAQRYLAVIFIAWIFFLLIYFMLKKYRPAFYLAIGLIGILTGGLIYSLKVAGYIQSNFFVNYAMQFGSILHFLILTVGLAKGIYTINRRIYTAENRVRISRERFDALVESSDEVIFFFDRKLSILSINSVVYRQLRMKPAELQGKNLLDFIYDRDEQCRVNRHKVEDILSQFNRDNKTVSFETILKTPGLLEPKHIYIQLEQINTGTGSEIIGKILTAKEDALVKHFCTETQSYSIPNLLLTANDVSLRVTRNLSRYITEEMIGFINMGLREIIINAMEHGNLAVLYEEKSAAQRENSYFELLETRRKDPRYESRRVHISSCLEPDKVTYTVTDEGAGFDHQSYVEGADDPQDLLMEAHGRGVRIATNIFDAITYNDKGNSVTLVKFFKTGTLQGL